MTLLDCQAKSCDNSLKPWPLYWELASTAARVPGPRQLVPEPSKWVGGVVVLVVVFVVAGGGDGGLVIANSYQSLVGWC